MKLTLLLFARTLLNKLRVKSNNPLSPFFKVCVGVDSEKELLDIGYNAVMLGLSVKYIEETTGFDKPTVTCLAIGPDYSSKIDPVTKHLKLL